MSPYQSAFNRGKIDDAEENQLQSDSSEEAADEAGVIIPSHSQAPKIHTLGFSKVGQDSTTYSREAPAYVKRSVKITRDSLAFIKST